MEFEVICYKVVGANGHEDYGVVSNVYENVQVVLGDIVIDCEFKDLDRWCKENGHTFKSKLVKFTENF